MTDTAQIAERGELHMLTLTWSREAFGNAMRVWTEGTRQWAPWFVPTALAKPAELIQQAAEFADRMLTQQEELARSLVRALPGPNPFTARPGVVPPAIEAGAGAEVDHVSAAALHRVEEERDQARAAEAAARRSLATVRAERDEAVRALEVAKSETRKARADTKRRPAGRSAPATARKAPSSSAKKASSSAAKKAPSSSAAKKASSSAAKKAPSSSAKKASSSAAKASSSTAKASSAAKKASSTAKKASSAAKKAAPAKARKAPAESQTARSRAAAKQTRNSRTSRRPGVS